MDQETQATAVQKASLVSRLGQALLTALLTVLYFIFVLPFKLWEFAVDSIGSKKAGDTFSDAFKTDVPLMSSYITFWNASIVVAPILIVILSIIEAATSHYYSFQIFLFGLFWAYTSPLLLTLFKEMLFLPISIANNIKKIADKK